MQIEPTVERATQYNDTCDMKHTYKCLLVITVFPKNRRLFLRAAFARVLHGSSVIDILFERVFNLQGTLCIKAPGG